MHLINDLCDHLHPLQNNIGYIELLILKVGLVEYLHRLSRLFVDFMNALTGFAYCFCLTVFFECVTLLLYDYVHFCENNLIVNL